MQKNYSSRGRQAARPAGGRGRSQNNNIPAANRRGRPGQPGQQRKPWYRRASVIVPIVILLPLLIAVGYYFVKTSALNQKVMVDASALPQDTPEALPSGLDELNEDEAGQIANQTPKDVYENPNAINLLLLGLDTRNPEQFTGGRTDTMIIVTFDTVNKKIKLTSIMRDTLVSIPGHDLNRINTVFGFCGPDVTMQTVQKYFGVKIDYYAVVNFWAVANIIDSVGGVEINVKESELEYLNKQLDEINRYNTGDDSPHVRKSGTQKLDGKQAVAYMRTRHVGEADFERTERQRNVLQSIANKDFSIAEVLSITNRLPDNVRTNANQIQMVSLANTAFSLKGCPITQFRLPIDGSYVISSYKKMSILKVDFDKNAAALKEFLQSK